jgi:hypothetical protein
VLRNTVYRGFRIYVVPLLALSLAVPLFSQSTAGRAEFSPQVKHDKSIPLRDMKPVPPRAWSSDPAQDADAAPRMSRAARQGVPKRVFALPQNEVRAQVNVSGGLNMDGVAADGTRATPDTNGAVGATQYVQWVNLQYEVIDKSSGNVLLGPVYGNTLWNGFGGDCETSDDGDIVAQYDKIANVWVMAQHAYPSSGGPPFYLCVAVSASSDATGAWYRYSFQLQNNDFPDYPKLSVWPDAYYVTLNAQSPPIGGTNLGAYVCALDRNSMLTGASASPAQCFQLPVTYQSLLAADLDGSILPPAGSPNYLLNRGTNSLNLWKFHVDWQTPANTTLTGPMAIPVAHFTAGCKGSGLCAPQLGTSQQLDGIGDRLMNRVAYRHFGDGHEALVASTTVNTPTGVAWYEIWNPGGTPVVFQQGTIAPDSNYRWMPSISMDQMGDIAVGYSVSSSSMLPAIRYSGRLQSDPLNTMENENSIIEGSGFEEGSNRWGDYSGMSIDPADDCTFFYTNQYQLNNGSYNWNTRIASFKFPSCTSNPPVTVAPNGLYFGDEAVGATSLGQTVTLTNTQASGLSISSITANGDFAQTNTCGSSVPGQGTCTITVTFTPTATGTRTGQIVVSDSASGSPQVVNMTGNGGSAALTLSQTVLNFSAFPGSTTAAKSVRLTNSGTAPLTVSSITASGDYSVSSNCTSSSQIVPKGSCNMGITFSPTVTGNILGTISIADSAPGAPHLISLSGTGLTTLSVAPTSLVFSTTSVGSTSAAQTVTVTNNASTAQTFAYGTGGNYTVLPGGAAPCAASPAALNPSAHCTLSLTFSPTTNGTIKGALAVTDNGSGVAYNPQIVSLSGSGAGGATPPFAFAPTTWGFGDVLVGSSLGPKSITLTNSTAKSISISGLTTSGNFSLTTSGGNPCHTGTILAAGRSCNLRVSFTPTVQGSQNGSVTVTDNAASGPTVQVFSLSGNGVWPITLSPGTLTFAAQAVGTTSAAKIVTVMNYSSSAVTIDSITPSAEYSVGPGGSSPCGATVPPASGQTPGSCTFAVKFTPAVTGTIKGTVTVSHNAAGNHSPQIISLTGKGE